MLYSDWCDGSDLKNKMGQIIPPKTNISSPENQWLEDVFPIEIVPFWGTC